MKKIIGINFLIDIYNIRNGFLEKEFLLKLLKKLIKFSKSTPVGKPLIKKISSPKYPFSGFSIIQIIQESHIALHTWPEYHYLAIDIFSCKQISEKEILNNLKKIFNKEVKIKFKKYLRVLFL